MLLTVPWLVTTDRVTLALATKVPATLELITTVHWPRALVPVEAQLSVTVPGTGLIVTVGWAPATGCNPPPPPLSALTVTVKVWAWPTSLAALGVMAMLASAKALVAGPEPPGPLLAGVAGLVSR